MDSFSDKVVITFHSHYDANKQKRKLEDNTLEASLIPVPRSLSSSCGTALVMDEHDFDTSLLISTIEGAFVFKEGRWSGLPKV